MSATPTNDVLFTAMTDAVWSGRCIAVLGAGISASDYPIWSALIHQLQHRCDVRAEDVRTQNFVDIAEAAKRKGDIYYSALDEIFQAKVTPQSLPRYHLLARIKFASYVTLNYDCMLLSAIGLHRNVIVSEYPHLRPDHGSGELFYLHGRLGPDRPAATTQIVLTRSEFEDAYDPYHNRLHAFVQSTVLDHDVCFIGCNPSEAHMTKLLAACERFSDREHGLGDNSRSRRFLLWDGDGKVPAKMDKCGIHVVRYPKKDSNFRGLDDVLRHWAKIELPRFRNAGTEPSPYYTDAEPGR